MPAVLNACACTHDLMSSFSETAEPSISPAKTASASRSIDPALLRMRELVTRLESAIHAGTETESIWRELRDCNRALTAETFRLRNQKR